MYTGMVSVWVVQHHMLMDTGCLQSIAPVSCCKAWKKGVISMVIVSGKVREQAQCTVSAAVGHLLTFVRV